MSDQQQQGRRHIAVRSSTYQQIEIARDELAKKINRGVTIGDVVDRAIDCLRDAHGRGAWLSPREAAPVMEQRHEGVIASVLAQFVARSMPDKQLRRIAFDRQNRTVVVLLADSDPVSLYVDSLKLEPSQWV